MRHVKTNNTFQHFWFIGTPLNERKSKISKEYSNASTELQIDTFNEKTKSVVVEKNGQKNQDEYLLGDFLSSLHKQDSNTGTELIGFQTENR